MKQYTFTDFVKWAVQVINPADLSALMSRFGYTDDSIESVEDAIEKSEAFQAEFGKLLGHWERKNQKEKSRSVNGVYMSNDVMTSDDWKEIASSVSLTKATGNIDPNKDKTKPGAYDWLSTILSGATAITGNIFGGGANNQQQPVNVTPTNTGQNTFLIIIAVVVVIAIGAIIWVSTKK